MIFVVAFPLAKFVNGSDMGGNSVDIKNFGFKSGTCPGTHSETNKSTELHPKVPARPPRQPPRPRALRQPQHLHSLLCTQGRGGEREKAAILYTHYDLSGTSLVGRYQNYKGHLLCLFACMLSTCSTRRQGDPSGQSKPPTDLGPI